MTVLKDNEACRLEECRSSSTTPQLTVSQWALIADLFPNPSPDTCGGHPRDDTRKCVAGILWVLRTGFRWNDLPREFPSYPTCWRRFAQWSSDGVWDQAWWRLIATLEEQGRIDWSEGQADGTFASAKKGEI